MNQIDDAELPFQAVCNKYPKHSTGFAGLAVVAQHRQRWDQALERWNARLANFPQQVLSSNINIFKQVIENYIFLYEDIRIAEILYSKEIHTVQINQFSQKTHPLA